MRSSFWDNVIWVILFIFLVPSMLVVASWKSLPGSNLYRIKLAAEDLAVAFAPSGLLKGQLQVAYTGKRLDEATELLSTEASGEGLEYFRSQIEEAKQAIANAPAGIEREQLAMQYVETLQNASHQLEQQKQIIETESQNGTVQPARTRVRSKPRQLLSFLPMQQPQPTIIVVQQVQQVTQVVQVVQVVQQIDQTQTQINDAINQVQQLQTVQSIQATATSTPTPTRTPTPTNTPTPTPVQGESARGGNRSAGNMSAVADPTATVTQAAKAAATETQAPEPTAEPTVDPTSPPPDGVNMQQEQ